MNAPAHSARVLAAAALLVFVLMGGAACGSGEGRSMADAGRTPATQKTPADVVIPEWDASTFDKSLNANGYTFIEFGGKSCKPCKQMQGILKELKSKHPALVIGNVYMEHSRDLLNAWKVQLIPTQVILDRNRKEIARHVGVWELEDILAECRKLKMPL